MKIILSNYRYFISGGPERYLFSIKEIFEKNGIEVFPFSVQSKKNIYTQWEKYFLLPITSDDSVYFNEYKKDLKTIFKVLERNFYSPEGFIKARRYAKLVEPDIIYSLHFLNKMSPSILDGFKSLGIPVVVRLSDFGLFCPQALMFSNNTVCESCINGSVFNCVRNKCVFNSFAGSLIKTLSNKAHKLIGSIDRINAFVCPSKFIKKKYIQAGFAEDKMHYIPTFIDTTNIEPDYSNNNYILYFGRIIEEKGVHILLKAYDSINGKKPELIIAGDTNESEFGRALKKKYSGRVHFMDFIPKNKLFPLIKKSILVVVPSIWYENLPNVLLESFAHGKAVIASNQGCFPDIIKEDYTGMLFEPGSAEDLSEKLKQAISNKQKMIEMGKNAKNYVEKYHNPEKHYEQLQSLFNSLI